MKFSYKPSTTLRYLMYTFLVLLISIGLYLFYYIPSNEEYFTSRNLRLLSDMSQNITQIIESYKSQIDKNFIDARASIIDKSVNARFSTFTRQEGDTLAVSRYLNQGVGKNMIKTQVEGIRHLKMVNSDFSFADRNSSRESFSDVQYQLDLVDNNYVLDIKYQGHKAGNGSQANSKLGSFTINLQIQAALPDIMEPFLKPDIFDNILLIEHLAEKNTRGRVIYQAEKGEFLATQLDTVNQNMIESWSSYHHQEVVWGNTKYRFYLQPVRVALLHEEYGKDAISAGEWMLVGVVDAGQFGADTRKISRFYISLWVFLFLMLLFGIPLIKLNFLGEREELRRSDLAYSLLSFFILSSLLTFWILSNTYARIDMRDMDYGLETLAEQLESNLFTELDDILSTFDLVNEKFAEDAPPPYTLTFSELYTDSTLTEVFSPESLLFDADEVESIPYPNFLQISWIDDSGHQKRKITGRKEVTPLVRVNQRQYFQKIFADEAWKIGDRKFYIEPIISITTGANLAVVSIPNDPGPEPVSMMAVNLQSLVQPVLPKGFGYCIVDEEGQVLFHSSRQKNMQENFFIECKNNPSLQAAVFSRTPKSLNVNYFGHEHRLYVKPLRNIPDWTLIAFGDAYEVHSYELSALLNALLLYVVLVLILTICMFAYLPFRFRDALRWFRPREELNKKYVLYSVVMLAAAGFYYSAIFRMHADTNLLQAFVTPFVVAILTNWFFRLNQKFLQRNANAPELGQKKKRIRNLLLFLAIITAILLFTFELRGLGLALGAAAISYILNLELVAGWISTRRYPNYYARFALCGMAFYLMTSVLPTIAFYKISYDSEKEVLIRRGQHALVKNLEQREARIKQEMKGLTLASENSDLFEAKLLSVSNVVDLYDYFFFATALTDHKDKSFEAFLDTSAHQQDLVRLPRYQRTSQPIGPLFLESNREQRIAQFQRLVEIDDLQDSPPTMVDSLFASIRSRIRLVDFQNWDLHKDDEENQSWRWKRWLTDPLSVLLLLDLENERFVSSYFRPLREIDSWAWVFWFLFTLFLLYVTLFFFVHKVFGINLYLPTLENRLQMPLRRISQNTIYIGQPNSGKSQVIEAIQDPKHIIDLWEVVDSKEIYRQFELRSKYEGDRNLFVLDHFGLRLDEKKWSHELLRFLEDLISKHKKTVILVSTVDPTILLRNLSQARATSAEKEGPSEEYIIDKNFFDRWALVLSSFTKIYHGIYLDDKKFEEDVDEFQKDKGTPKGRQKNLKKVLLDECRHTLFLQGVGLDIAQKFDLNQHFTNEEALIDEIRLRSDAYYHSIWSTCSIDEKITLIHLARNGFVPYKDRQIVILLIRKGMVSSSDYRLMNESFSNFVLTAESSDVIQKWKKQREQTWADLRTPIVTFSLALLAFIFFSQRELFNIAIAWVTAIGALIPILYRITNTIIPQKGDKMDIPKPD